MTREEAITILDKLWEDFDRLHETTDYVDGYEEMQALAMAIEALQADAVQGAGRYENAMQKLREIPRYLNGVKEKQIKKIPSEVVELVRCKDCRHGVLINDTEVKCNLDGDRNAQWKADDFCSYGERKEG